MRKLTKAWGTQLWELPARSLWQLADYNAHFSVLALTVTVASAVVSVCLSVFPSVGSWEQQFAVFLPFFQTQKKVLTVCSVGLDVFGLSTYDRVSAYVTRGQKP